MSLNSRFWKLLDRFGAGGRAALDWRLHVGARWMSAPIYRTPTIAFDVEDPHRPGERWNVREEDGLFVLLPEDSLKAVPASREEVEVWMPDWRRMAEQLAEAHEFNECEPEGSGATRRIGIFHSSKSPRRDVYLHISHGFFGAHEELFREVVRLRDCFLLLTSEQRADPAIHELARARNITIQTILGNTEEASLHAVSVVSKPARKKSEATLPIFAVRKDWGWTSIKIEAHPDHIKISRGLLRKSHAFRPSNKIKYSKFHEILLSMALNGNYVFGQSEGKSRDADKRAFQRLVIEMKNLIPIEGEPFFIDQEEARPVFEIRAAKGVKDWRVDLMAEDD
jgi:hypothetical protein